MQIFRNARSVCDWQATSLEPIPTEEHQASCANLVDMCIKNGSLKPQQEESKDPEQPTTNTEMNTFRKNNCTYHVSSLGEFQLVVVCESSDDEKEQNLKFFDFHESLMRQINDKGLQDKELTLCLSKYIAEAVSVVYSSNRDAIIAHGDRRFE